MQEGQRRSAGHARSSRPNVSAVPRPTVAGQVSNQATTPPRNFCGALQVPTAAAATTPRALAEYPAAAVGATAGAASLAPAEADLAAPTAAAVAATAPAGTATAAPPVLPEAATAPAKAHEETRGAGNTSVPVNSFCTVARPVRTPFAGACELHRENDQSKLC